jgi:hypothetical protein
MKRCGVLQKKWPEKLRRTFSQGTEVKLFDIGSTDFSELAYEMIDAKAFVIVFNA